MKSLTLQVLDPDGEHKDCSCSFCQNKEAFKVGFLEMPAKSFHLCDGCWEFLEEMADQFREVKTLSDSVLV